MNPAGPDRPRSWPATVTARRRRAVRVDASRLDQLVGCDRHPAAVVAVVTLIAGAGALLAAGPVAAFVAAGYLGAGSLTARAVRLRGRARRSRTVALEAIGAMVADLRAGLPLDLGEATDQQYPPTVAIRLRAARRLGGRLGAPLADLLERVETDLRAAQLLAVTVDGELAGIRATTAILMLLPLMGVVLGAGLGADPVHQLLHTRLGAVCTVLAVTAQGLGSWWTAALAGHVRGRVAW